MASTMNDVAKLAGVSPSTVSRVLNHSYLVEEKTVQKVMDAIKKLNYQVNDSARSLRTNDRSVLGFIGSGLENSFLGKVLKGAEAEAQLKGYQILIGDSEGEYEREVNYLNLMQHKQVGGIVIVSANVCSSLLNMVSQMNIPVIFASGYVDEKEINCVSVDNLTGGFDAIEYLIQMGHREIGMIRGPYSDVITSDERMKGVRLALSKGGIRLNEKMVAEGEFTFESGYTGAKDLLNINGNISAIFAFNDEMAIGAMKYIHDIGKKVPDDISVIGFDNIQISEFITPSLTTIAQSGEDLGSTCIKMLDQLITDGSILQNKVVLPHQLIERSSVKKL